MATKTVQLNVWFVGVRPTTISEGQTIELRHSAPTEEGYEYETVTLSYFDDTLYLGEENGGRDCDGPISRYLEKVCHESELTAVLSPNGKTQWPNWIKKNSYQRDLYAERAGY